MTTKVKLVAPAMNAALREARFGGDAPLDATGTLRARAAAGEVPKADRYASGPSERCVRTAEALGLTAGAEPVLRDWDMGRWCGLRLSDVGVSEPGAVSAWLSDPSAAPHGGESLRDLSARIAGWLQSLPDGVSVLAVVDPAVVRAAVVHGLELPPEAFWRLDVGPLTLTELSGRPGRWNLRCGLPLASGYAGAGPGRDEAGSPADAAR